jgi:NAD-dependent deacetylase
LPSPLSIDADTHLLVLTGAGVSAESGIPTFRDANGLWENHAVEDVASPEGFSRDPALVWRFYSQRRAAAKTVAPNAGHEALARVERRLLDRFLLVTQNVDGLHLRARSERVVELHGNLFTSRCSTCERPPFHDEFVYEGALPECDLCRERGKRALLRPHIVWFGEMLYEGDLERVDAFMDRAAEGQFVFLAVGTSGVVYPAAGLAEQARARGADTWLLNADPAGNQSSFDHFIKGRSAELLTSLLGV